LNIQRTTCFRNASTRAGGYGYLVWHLYAVAGTSCDFAALLSAQSEKRRV